MDGGPSLSLNSLVVAVQIPLVLEMTVLALGQCSLEFLWITTFA